MKIICDNCKTKYSIADEKVKGKVFKIRCKKCSNIIVVRGNQGAEAADQSEPASYAGGAEKDAPTWHVVIDQKQVGPMTAAEVRERFMRGEIDCESYIWREGFSDWLRLTQIDVFADLAQTMPASAPAETGGDMGGETYEESAGDAAQRQWSDGQPAAAPASWSADGAQQGGGGLVWDHSAESSGAPASWSAPDSSAGGGLFGGGASDEGGGDLFGSAQSRSSGSVQPAVSPAAGGGLFVAPAAAAGGADGQQMFPAEQPQPAGRSQLTGARNENSVLFSLSNLQALAMGGGGKSTGGASASASAGAGTTDGSGLIDIRAMGMAPARGSRASDDGLPDLGGFAAPIAAAPVLLPGGDSERPAWLLPTIIGGGAFLLIAIVVIIVLLAVRKPPPVVVAAAPTVPTPAAATPPPAAPTAAAPSAEAQKAAAEKAAASEEGKAEAKATTKRRPTKGGKRGAKGGLKVAANTAGADEGGEESGGRTSRPKAAGKHDALDDLIDGAVGSGGKGGGGRRAARAPSGGDDNLPETLDRAQIQAGMRGIKGRVQGCVDRFKVPGLANVQVKIGNNGRVSSARVLGLFAGTPTGACVEAAAMSAQFQRFKGAPVTVTYPFILK